MFKLTIENFRCYEGRYKWSFELNEIHLFRGDSGIGKSTIFEALNYGLYGVGQNIKPHMKPNSKTMVKITLIKNRRKLKIIRRTKNDYHAIYKDKKYDKESADFLIHRFFETNKKCNYYSYVKQKLYK